MTDTPNTVKLTDYTVELVQRMTWGKQEVIRGAMYGGMKVRGAMPKEGGGDVEPEMEMDASAISKSKYKTIEVCIARITKNDDNTEVPFSVAWLNDLPVEDGDALYQAVNKVAQAKKK